MQKSPWVLIVTFSVLEKPNVFSCENKADLHMCCLFFHIWQVSILSAKAKNDLLKFHDFSLLPVIFSFLRILSCNSLICHAWHDKRKVGKLMNLDKKGGFVSSETLYFRLTFKSTHKSKKYLDLKKLWWVSCRSRLPLHCNSFISSQPKVLPLGYLKTSTLFKCLHSPSKLTCLTCLHFYSFPLIYSDITTGKKISSMYLVKT